MKTEQPCTDPWCRGRADGGCGRTPNEHIEDGLSYEQWFAANPPLPGLDEPAGVPEEKTR